MRKKNLLNIFLREKPARSLLLLRKAGDPLYASVIAKKIDSTHAHTLGVLSKMAELGLVTFEQVGRIKLVRLTEIGAGVADVLRTFEDMEDLIDIERKIERIQRKEVQGRRPAEINWVGVSKRLARCGKELGRLGVKKPELKEYAKNLKKRIEQFLAESRKPKKSRTITLTELVS